MHELPLREGELVTVLAPPRADGLVEAQAHGRRGLAPITHLEEYNVSSQAPRTRLLGQMVDSAARRNGAGGVPPTASPRYHPGATKYMRARLDFDPADVGSAELPTDGEVLAFRKGDTFSVNYGQAGRADGYVPAVSEDGLPGLVPLQFLEELRTPELSRANSGVFPDMWVEEGVGGGGGEVGK